MIISSGISAQDLTGGCEQSCVRCVYVSVNKPLVSPVDTSDMLL